MRLLLRLLVLLVLPFAAARAEPMRGPALPSLRGQPALYALFRVPAPVPTPATTPAPAPPAPAAVLAPPPAMRPAMTAPGTTAPGTLCRAAISAAERAHGIPAGLLLAIGLVESGRTDPRTGERNPWPWAVNAEGRGALLETREAALAFVRQAEASGVRSIDTGCMQVNRVHHPNAFASLEQAFEPMANADYAARFLKQLKEGPAGGDWMKAAGFYHSQTPERADGYRTKVQAALGGLPSGARTMVAASGPPPPAPGGGGQMLGNGAAQAAVLAAPAGMGGRDLAAYRARPVPLALVVQGLRRGVSAAP